MAHIDELVSQITDQNLRESIMQQVKTLTSRKEFGLVFQRHSPETVILAKQLVRSGNTVVQKADQQGTRYKVISAKGDEARIIELDAAGEPLEDVDSMVVERENVVVIKNVRDGIYPGLKLLGEVGENAAGRRSHIVIKGENYHALRALEYTHRDKVDLIYIDPPYNTGAADWKYNDKFVDGNDAYRHSKWLSFMEKRLEVAKSLLKDTGVLVIAIDDNEHARLKMLADQVLGEGNFLNNIIWQGGYDSRSRFASRGHDYMLVYCKNAASLRDSGAKWVEKKPGIEELVAAANEAWESSEGNHIIATDAYRQWLNTGGKSLSGGLRHYTGIDSEGRVYQPGDLSCPAAGTPYWYEIIHPFSGVACKMSSRGWGHSPERFKKNLSEGRILFGADHTTIPRFKRFITDSDLQVPRTVFEKERFGASKHLSNVLGESRFPYPKDHEVLARWFRMVAPQDALIVDFFAGSGTTAEAVIQLNDEDGGNRQSILVTNNEMSRDEDKKLRKQGYEPGDEEYEMLGVFDHVTMPRISTVLTGIRPDESKYSDGIQGQSAKFYELTYEDENLVSLGSKFEAVAPLLWMQAGCGGEVVDALNSHAAGGSGYSVPADANYAVIFNSDSARDAIEEFHDGVKHVFVVTDSSAEFQSIVQMLPAHLRGKSRKLYSDYLRSFAIRR